MACPHRQSSTWVRLNGPWGTQKVGAMSSSSDPPSWLCCGTDYDVTMIK